MTLSLVTILACITAMVSSTFALFYQNISTSNSTLEAAYYSVAVTPPSVGMTYTTPLAPEDKHTFVITADGTATTGYCKILVGDVSYYTTPIQSGGFITLTIQAAVGTAITFSPGWGAAPDYTTAYTYGNGGLIVHSVTPHATYTVEATARLSNIAAHYKVNEADILLYNSLATTAYTDVYNAPVLAVGMELKIPNADFTVPAYAVPYATYIVEPTATLEAISAHYLIPIADIIAFNDMMYYGAGFTLKIPNASPTLPAYAVPYATYIVEPTATLEAISTHYGVSPADILAFNNITEITVGMPLKIPNTMAVTAYAVPYAVYTIQEGAKLENIALHYGVSVESILTYNGHPVLTAGYALKIPGVDPMHPAYNYVAPVPVQPPVINNPQTGNTDLPASGGDVSVLDPTASNTPTDLPQATDMAAQVSTGNPDYTLLTSSTLKLSEADVLLYEGKVYQQGVDVRFGGLQGFDNTIGCQHSTTLQNNAEILSLCLSASENMELGYVKIRIGEREYFSTLITKDAYIRLDIAAPIGSLITLEAYEGIPTAEIFYGDNLKNDVDGNNPLLNHTLLMMQNNDTNPPTDDAQQQPTDQPNDQSTEQPDDQSAEGEVTTANDGEGQPADDGGSPTIA